MQIAFNKHKYSKYIENHVRKCVEEQAAKVLGHRTKIITKIQVNLESRFSGNKPNDYNNMFDHGVVLVKLFPNWTTAGPYIRNYGVRHELIHVRDVMDGLLMNLPPKPGKNYRVKYRATTRHKWKFYDRYVPEWLGTQIYDNCDYEIFYKMLSAVQPWEAEALSDKWYNRLVTNGNL